MTASTRGGTDPDALRQWRRQCFGAAVAFCIAIWGSTMLVSSLVGAVASNRWPRTMGLIVKSDVWSTKSGGSTKRSASIHYEYRAGNRTWRNDQVRIGRIQLWSDAEIDELRALYAKGNSVPVYHHRSRTWLSVIEPGLSLASFYALPFALIPTLVGLILLRGRPNSRTGRIRLAAGDVEIPALAREPFAMRRAMNRLFPAFALGFAISEIAAALIGDPTRPDSAISVAYLGMLAFRGLALAVVLLLVLFLNSWWLHNLPERTQAWIGGIAGVLTPLVLLAVRMESSQTQDPTSYYFGQIMHLMFAFGHVLTLILLGVAGVYARRLRGFVDGHESGGQF